MQDTYDELLDSIDDELLDSIDLLKVQRDAWRNIADRERAALERLLKALANLSVTFFEKDQMYKSENVSRWMELQDAQRTARQVLGNREYPYDRQET